MAPAFKITARPLLLYFALAYGIAWLFLVPLALSQTGIGWLPFAIPLPLMTVLATAGPSLAALLTLRITEHRWPKLSTVRSVRRFIAGLLLAPCLIAFAFVVAPAILLATGPLSELKWSVLLSASVFNASTIIGGPLGEEPGWRGFALPRLQDRFGPAKASILLGTLWAGWHLPLFFCKGWTSSGFPTYLLMMTGVSLLIAFVYNLSGGSVIVAIAAHASFNTVGRWLGGLLEGVATRDTPSPELILGLCGWTVAGLLLVATRGRLGTPKLLS